MPPPPDPSPQAHLTFGGLVVQALCDQVMTIGGTKGDPRF